MPGLNQKLQMRQEQLQLQLPQQILRSELIQMPLLELELRVKEELEENPFVEELEESREMEQSANDRMESPSLNDESPEKEDNAPDPAEKTAEKEIDWDTILNDANHSEYRVMNRRQTDDTLEIPQPHIPSLSDQLHEQLHLDFQSNEDILIGEEIIGNLNRDGYLEVDYEELALTTGASLDNIKRVHGGIMKFEPIGIAARDLRECLLVQLYNRDPRWRLTERMLEEFWNDFINKRFEKLADKLESSLEEIKKAFSLVARLDPKPGEGYFDEKQNYIIPDLVVRLIGSEFEVYLNDGDIPNFHINRTYREMYLKRKGADKKVREFLSRKLESARWFLTAIHQRRTTMLRTMRAIIECQIDFFREGPTQLKPMILADIAEKIEMDISTISRVTNGKYVQTDWGVFELKYFFSEKMSTDEGDTVSNRVIKSRLRELIDNEDKLKPLSDQQLTDLLNNDGFLIKRRTVAKYREQLRLPVKRLRRSI